MYAKEKVQLSLKCLGELAEVFNRNRDLRNRFVLTGGWAPYFITKERFEHTGSIDIDLVLSNSVLIAYTKIADIMKNILGYEQTAPFEFTKKMDNVVMQVHFLVSQNL